MLFILIIIIFIIIFSFKDTEEERLKKDEADFKRIMGREYGG